MFETIGIFFLLFSIINILAANKIMEIHTFFYDFKNKNKINPRKINYKSNFNFYLFQIDNIINIIEQIWFIFGIFINTFIFFCIAIFHTILRENSYRSKYVNKPIFIITNLIKIFIYFILFI